MKTIESVFRWMSLAGLLIWIVAILFPGIIYNGYGITIELWKLGLGGFVLGMAFYNLQELTALLCKFKNIPTKYYWNIYVPQIAFIIYMSATIIFLYFTTISMAVITLSLSFIWIVTLGLVGRDYIQSLKDSEVSVTVRRSGTATTYTTEE